MQKLAGVLILALLVLPKVTTAQELGDFPALETTSYSREFAGQTVSTEFVARAGGSLLDGQRGFLMIDLNTTLSGNNPDMPRAVVINGFVTVALPPGLEPDGPPRLMFYDEARGQYDFLYSKAYPDLPRFAGLSQAIEDTTSGNPGKMLLGLDSIIGALDSAVYINPPSDPRLTGLSKDYAITGVSWLIPCNVQFMELVSLFDRQAGLGTTARLRVRLPLKADRPLTNTTVVVYAGGLSSAVDLASLLPEEIPATAIPLAPLPVTTPAATAEPAVEAEAPPAEPEAEPEPENDPPPLEGLKLGSDGQDEVPEILENVPAAPVPIPTLVYSHDWVDWQVELDLAALLPAPVIVEQIQTQQIPPEVLPQEPVDLGGEISIAPATTPLSDTTPPPVQAEPQTPVERPQPTTEQPAARTEDQPTTAAATETEFSPTPQANTEVRQVEPGTLPAATDSYTVALKPITGSGSGGASATPAASGVGGPDPAGGVAAGNSSPPAGLGEMILIPEGYFLMGTAGNSSAGDADELPQTQVYLPAYYIDKYPVTNRQFYDFCLSAGYKPAGNWDKYYAQGTADLPVRGVTWDDASAYARWAGKRLPTEAEWEKAARGEDGRTYPWGEDWSADILPRGEYLYDIMTAPATASPYGVMGMVGLVWQWTSSALQPYPFNPEARGDKLVLRGGAFSNGRNIVRCANRYSESANVALNTFSFRCAKDAA